MPNDPRMTGEVELTAAKFASMHIGPAAEDADHFAPRFPREIFSLGVQAGFDKFVLPESAGGCGFGMSEFGSLISTLAGTCAGHAMVFGVHAAALKSIFDSGAEGAQEILNLVMSSASPIGAAIPDSVPGGGIDAPATIMRKADGILALDGPAGLAVNVAPEGFILLFAKTEAGEPAALLVATDELGIGSKEPEPSLGLRAMPMMECAPGGVSMPSARLLAEGEAALCFHRILIGNLCIAVSAASAGLMQKAFRAALAYAADRYQGGRTIIDHSHMRSMLGSMSSDVTASVGAAFCSALQPADFLAALGTKVFVTDCAVRVCTDAVQVLGGYGYMLDYGVEKAMRDAAVLSLLPISNSRGKLLIAELEKNNL